MRWRNLHAAPWWHRAICNHRAAKNFNRLFCLSPQNSNKIKKFCSSEVRFWSVKSAFLGWALQWRCPVLMMPPRCAPGKVLVVPVPPCKVCKVPVPPNKVPVPRSKVCTVFRLLYKVCIDCPYKNAQGVPGPPAPLRVSRVPVPSGKVLAVLMTRSKRLLVLQVRCEWSFHLCARCSWSLCCHPRCAWPLCHQEWCAQSLFHQEWCAQSLCHQGRCVCSQSCSVRCMDPAWTLHP